MIPVSKVEKMEPAKDIPKVRTSDVGIEEIADDQAC